VFHDAFAVWRPSIDAKGEVSSRRGHLRPLLLHSSWGGRYVGQALATEAIAESIRNDGVWEAESNIKLFDFVSTPAATDWDASFTVERINCQENTAKAFRRKCEFDEMREVSFVR
jgi:hypothetical protein